MLKRGDYLMIQHKHDDGVYIKDIAEELGVHPRTVSRALRRGAAPTGKRPRARDENRLEKQLQQWVYPKVLILDEMGYLPLSREDASLLFRLVQRRYEKASLILTSNKSFIDWGEIFGDQVLATAILDRLLHHATTLNIKGESYRLKEKRKAGLLGRAPVMKPERLPETD